MREFSNIFPLPPKLCLECENKQYEFLQFRKENEDNMTREELNNALATKFNCCDQCKENTRKYFEKQNSASSLSPLTTLTVNLLCWKLKKSFLVNLLTYLNVILRTVFDSLYFFFQILFCLVASNIIDIPDKISVYNIQIPFKVAEQRFYTTVFNCFLGLVFLEIISYYFYLRWRTSRYNFNLRSVFFFIVGWVIKIAMGIILFEKQQHEYQISFNPFTYYALVLAIIDIYLTRRQLLSNKIQTPISRSNVSPRTQSTYSQSESQIQNKEANRNFEEESEGSEDYDSNDSGESGMDVESNKEDTGADSSFTDINFDNLKIKQGYSPKKSGNKTFVYPHQQQTGFQVSPQSSHKSSFQQQSPGNIFQSPTTQQHQPTSPNIFQQRSPTTNSEFFKTLFTQQPQQQQRQQQQQFPSEWSKNENSKRPNHVWSK